MKHSLKRTISLITAVLLLALIPTAVLAATYEVPVYSELYNSSNAKQEELMGSGSYQPGSVTVSSEGPVKVVADDYEKFITEGGKIYKLLGINSYVTYNPQSSVTIPPMPDPNDAEAFGKWSAEWSGLYLAYAPHEHESEIWFTTLTNHWQFCDECGEKFNMNWHWDKDENEACDDCEDPIHYYTITIKDMEGGTVTISKDKAMLNDEIQVTVTPAEGYKLKEIRFYNLNEVHSQLVRYEDVPGSEYHFIVLPWDIEIEADFVPAE